MRTLSTPSMGPLICLLTGILTTSAFAANFSYSGNFLRDDDKRLIYFSVSQPGDVTIRTWSYAGGVNAAGTQIPPGGFDPTLSLYNSNGDLIANNRDGGCGLVAPDAVTAFCWDARLTVPLPAGDYRVVLTQSENMPNGPSLADSFVYEAQGNFTPAPGSALPGFWDFYPSKRTDFYALDIQGAAAAQVTTITSSAILPRGITNQTYPPFTFTVEGGPGTNYIWTVVRGEGALPQGLTLTPAGILQGIPTVSGIFPFIVQVDDGVQPVQQSVTITVYDPLLITTSTLPSGVATQAYGPVVLLAVGGSGAHAWSANGLPAGLAISTAGEITGTPLIAGASNINISAIDTAANLTASASYSLQVAFAPLLITSAGNLGGYTPGSIVSHSFAASGGKIPYAWSGAGLPAGFSLNPSSGSLNGAAAVPGNYSFQVQVTDSQPVTAEIPVSFSVLGITTSSSLPNATTTTAYSLNFSAVGGSPPYSFSASGVPGGMAFDGSGLLQGTPQTVGNYNLNVQVTDSVGLSVSSQFSLIVTGPPSPLNLSGGPLISGTVAKPYSLALQATGGAPPYTWSLLAGALPDEFTLSETGTIHGTSPKVGFSTFTVQVTDSSGGSVSAGFTLAIGPLPLTLSGGGSFPNGIVGSDYPLQILAVSGGVAPYKFAVTSGALPDGLSFADGQFGGIPTSAGSFSFGITVTDAIENTASGSFQIIIKPTQPDLILSSSSVPFSLTTGAVGLPTPAAITVRSSVILELLNYSIVVTPPAPWLSVTGGGTTPDSIVVQLNSAALSLASSNEPYRTSITVSCDAPSPCAGNTQSITIELTVNAPPPQIIITSNLLSFSALTSNLQPASQTIGLQNNGGGSIVINSILVADSWATVTGAPATLTGGPAVPLTVTMDPAGLAAGYHRTTIKVESSAGSASFSVGLLIAETPAMSLNPAGQQFQMPAGNSPGNPAGTFRISVSSGSIVNWNAALLSGAGWLKLNSASGTATAAIPGTVNFSIDTAVAANLAPQAYYALIRVTSPDVVDSPLDFEVILNVTAASDPVKPQPEPPGLVFITSASAGIGATLPPQIVQVFASSTIGIPYQASASTDDGGSWLLVSPATGTSSAASAAQSSVSVNTANLPLGVYRGGVSYAFSAAAVRTVNVTLIVQAPGPGHAPTRRTTISATSPGCTPAQLVPTQTGLVNNFAQPAAWPTPLSILVSNDCGGVVNTGQVVATFSNGDPPLSLKPVDLSSGVFSATWTPRSTSSQVTIAATATAPGFAPVTALITGQVSANAAPLLTPNGTLHVFAPAVGASLGPGTIIQIYGSNLAAGITEASVVPLATTLNGTSVIVGGVEAPLYYVSPGQINAQLPFELAADKRYQMIINANGALSTPETIQLAAVAPGIAAFATGQIIAQHPDYSLVSEASPAKPGEFIVFYVAGFGLTDGTVVTGNGSPSFPLARPLNPPALTLNGSSVPILFAGLTPTQVGLYQVNFQIPAETPDGDIQLLLTQSGAKSNTTILPVHH
jgi:uncharacterized protein (TIGR03437 family)